MDWNDLHQARGLDECRRQLYAVLDAHDAKTREPEKGGAGAQDEPPRPRWLNPIGELLKTVSAPSWLIKGVLEQGAFGAVVGPSGSGKSLVALAMAACVATGKDFYGRSVAQGLAIYLCAEGYHGVLRRLLGWSKHFEISLEAAPLFVSRTGARLDRAEDAGLVRVRIRETVEQYGQPPALIIIDTLARNFAGDENSAADMGAFIRNLEVMGQEWGSTVLVVHHTGKDARQGARGSTALRGALDAEYSIMKDVGDNVVLRSEKMKDAAPPLPISFEMESVELPLQDDEGNPVFGVVLAERSGYQPPTGDAARLGRNEQAALNALDELFQEYRERLEHGGGDPSTARVEVSEWRARADLDRKRWPEVRDQLERKGLVRLCPPYVELIG